VSMWGSVSRERKIRKLPTSVSRTRWDFAVVQISSNPRFMMRRDLLLARRAQNLDSLDMPTISYLKTGGKWRAFNPGVRYR